MLRRSSTRASATPQRRGPGLLGTIARTAVISGTATATSNVVNSKMTQSAMQAQQEQAAAVQTQAEMEQMKAQLAAMQSMPVQAAPVAPASTPAQPDLLGQITQLAQLKASGVLSEAEFQLAKAKLLS